MEEIKNGIYVGKSRDELKQFITKIFKDAKIKEKYINILTSDESMLIFSKVFTSKGVHPFDNYEYYEIIGDAAAGHFLVEYFSDKFPFLKSSEGVKIIARLKINYGSKATFYTLAENLGFWEYIICTNSERQTKKKSLLEDTLEAFAGATEEILNDYKDFKKKRIGFNCVYIFFKSIFEKYIKISLDYKNLYDAKTRLKELMDLFKEKLGKIEYKNTRVGEGLNTKTKSEIILNERTKIGDGLAAIQADAEQIASENALSYLNSQGFIKHDPLIYKEIQQGKKTVDKTMVKKLLAEANINDQIFTRGKAKSNSQEKYTSTAIIYYAFERSLEGMEICMELGADPNIKDSVGMTAADALIIGTENNIVLEGIKILGKNNKLLINKDIYKNYWIPFYSDKSDFKNFIVEKK